MTDAQGTLMVEDQRAAWGEDTPTEVREEPLKPLEQSTEVEEMPVQGLEVVAKLVTVLVKWYTGSTTSASEVVHREHYIS